MTETQRHALERIDDLLQQLSEIDPHSLTEAEQEARTDVMASVYARATYVYSTMKQESNNEDKQPLHSLLSIIENRG